MAGSLQWKSGRWYGVFRIDGKPKWIGLPKDIKQTQRTKAQRVLDELIVDSRRGDLPTDNHMTVERLMELWMEHRSDKQRATTAHQNTARIRLHINPHLGSMKIADVRPSHVEQFFRQITRTKEGAVGLSPQTVRIIATMLNGAFNLAVKWDMIPKNPVQYADKPSGESKAKRVLNAEEFRRMTDALKGTIIAVPALILGMTGMRRSELLGLTWDNVDLENAQVRVERGLVNIGSKLVWEDPKSKKSARTIPLPALAVAALTIHREEQAARKKDRGITWIERNLVFDDGCGDFWRPTTFSTAFGICARKAGFAEITPHCLRHGYASVVYDATGDLKMVQELLGHSTLAVTSEVYTKVFESKKRATVKQVESIFERSNRNTKPEDSPPIH